jgi:Cu2+-exporting ATPase
LAKVTHVVFDKTGTLTEGRLSLVQSVVLGKCAAERCVAVASALECGSEHPIAAAMIAAGADGRPALRVERLRNVSGAGIEGVIDAQRFRIGARAFVAQIAGEPSTDPGSDLELTQVWLGSDGQWLARFDFSDCIRVEAAAVVRRLRDCGKRVFILSGDALPAVQAAAERLGIAEFEAALSPEGKYARVHALQAEGAVVAMVGDGVNDAPVLAQAQVSIAMGSGALLSQAQADIVLLSGRLQGMLEALDIVRSTWSVVRQNLVWAVAYNVIAVPAAAMGWVTPWIAGAGMGASSLIVVLNALRLLRADVGYQRSDVKGVTSGASTPVTETGPLISDI